MINITKAFSLKTSNPTLLITRAASVGVLVTLLSPSFAIRPYQEFWQKKIAEMEAVEVIEDNRSPRDVSAEYRLFDGSAGQMLNLGVFPGSSDTYEDPVAQFALRHYVEGAVRNQEGSPIAALKSYNDAMKKDPENSWLGLRVAEAAIQVNDLSRAEGILQDLLEQDENNYRAHLLMGEVYSLRRRYNDAKVSYQAVLDEKPNNIHALQKMAQLSYEVDNDIEKLKEYANRILKVDDRNLAALLWNAEACAQTGEPEEAANLYARLIRYRPSLVLRMADMGRRLAAAGRTDDAIILFQRALMTNPSEASLRSEWEKLVREKGGESAVREAYVKLVEENADSKLNDIYADYLRQRNDWEELYSLRLTLLNKDPHHIPALMDMAKYYLRKDDFEEARKFFGQALATNPSDADIFRDIAFAHRDYGDTEEARRLLAKALVMAPDDISTLEVLADMEAEDGNYDKAESLLREALKQSPVNSQLLRKLGLLYLDQGERRSAKDLFSQVLVANQFDFETWLLLAKLHLEDGELEALDTMESSYRMTMQAFPDVDIRYGGLSQAFGDYDRSRRALERAVKAAPSNLKARFLLSQAYLHLEEYDLAIQAIKEAKEYTVGSADEERDRLLRLADIYTISGKPDEALQSWKEALEEFPDSILVWETYLHGLVQQDRQKELGEGLSNIVRRFKIDEPILTDQIRASVFVKNNEAPRAVRILELLVKDNPEDATLRLDLAMAYGEADELDKAETHYRALIEDGPEGPFYTTSLNNLGYLLSSESQRLDEAEELVSSALERDPHAAYILDSMGWVLFKKGDYERARPYLERAAKLSLQDADVFLHLGQLYEATGDTKKARDMYDKALGADPRLDLAREKRDALVLNESSNSSI